MKYTSGTMGKPIILLSIIFCLSTVTLSAQAQGTITSTTPEEFLQFLREKQKPSLINQLKLTDEQAEKIIAIQAWAAPILRKISFETTEDQKPILIKQLNEEKEKRYRAITLTENQVEAVIEFYANMLKNRTWPDGVKH